MDSWKNLRGLCNYVLKNVNYLRQCCFFAWHEVENVIQE
jgi:hypothetical protein